MILLYNINYISGQSEWVRLDQLTALSRPGASLRPARACRSRDHFGTDSVRSKLPPLFVPVSPSPFSREACRDLWCSIGPSTMVVFKLRTSLSVRQNILADLIVFRAKQPLYLLHSDMDETADTSVSDERRKKAAELHKSGAKRAET